MATCYIWWWVLINILAPSIVVGFPSGDGWEWMSITPQLDGTQFMDFASPLVQMSANAYRYPGDLQSIPGWSPSSQIGPLYPPRGGAHALVFEEQCSCKNSYVFAHLGLAPQQQSPDVASRTVECTDGAHRVIIAFRGTQIAPTIDSLADLCADQLLWEGLDYDSLPSNCSIFDESTLDYFSQALNYTLQVIDVYPSARILLTGHSLGAGLAILVAGALSHIHTLPVIGFGAPGTKKPLLDRGISIESLENGRIIIIGNEWDAIMRTQMEGQVGLLCMYPQSEPSSCKACIQAASRLPSADGEQHCVDGAQCLVPPGCMDCFLVTHYLKKLIALVDLAIKPSCQQA